MLNGRFNFWHFIYAHYILSLSPSRSYERCPLRGHIFVDVLSYIISLLRNSLERIPGYLNDLGEKVPDTILQKCYYEGAFFENGQQWQSSHVQCQMCRLETETETDYEHHFIT